MHPGVLLDAVGVLVGAHGVSDSFDAIENRANEVVGGVGLVLGASSMMGSGVAAVEDWVAHALVEGFHVDLGSDAIIRGFIGKHVLAEFRE